MKLIEIITDESLLEQVQEIGSQHQVKHLSIETVLGSTMHTTRFYAPDDLAQTITDELEAILTSETHSFLAVIPIESFLPRAADHKRASEDSALLTRENLRESVEKNARLDINFVVLVILSTLVACIGLIENNIAVIIGAMVIAPLLGPNLALGLGTALGDTGLIKSALKTNLAGIFIAGVVTLLIGVSWPHNLDSHELISRTRVGPGSIVLALASGAAAALSITTGLSSVLVGVMVAVALLPPTATLGLMLSQQKWDMALGASLLLGINVVCLNLSSKIIFFWKGVQPRTWWEKKKAKRAGKIYITVWSITLLLLFTLIYLTQIRAT